MEYFISFTSKNQNSKWCICKIIEHLDLWRIPEQPRPPPEKWFTPPQHNPCPATTEQDELFEDDWPGYEELLSSGFLESTPIISSR